MQYTVIGLDGTDEEALNRRLAVRADHIKRGEQLLESGNLLYGCALLSDDDQMIGSIYVLWFDTQNEFDSWYNSEPYVVGDVWKDIKIYNSRTNDPAQFNRPKEWHDNLLN